MNPSSISVLHFVQLVTSSGMTMLLLGHVEKKDGLVRRAFGCWFHPLIARLVEAAGSQLL
jgi:hypothetical protein